MFPNFHLVFLTFLHIYGELTCDDDDIVTQNNPLHILTSKGQVKFCDRKNSEEPSCERGFQNLGERDSEREEESDSGTVNQKAMALVLYDESVISPFHKENRSFWFGDIQVDIAQDWKNAGVAAVVWDAAVVLGEYIEKNRWVLEKGPVLELGAGTGLAGLVATIAGGDVTITDRQVALHILEKNVDLNRERYPLDKAHIQELEWGKDLDQYPTYKLVLGADIIYIEETFSELLQTLLHVCDSDTVVLLSCKIRYARDSRFLTMMEQYFTVKEIYFDKSRDIHIYRCNKL